MKKQIDNQSTIIQTLLTELQELNRNLFDIDNSLSGIKTWIQNHVESN